MKQTTQQLQFIGLVQQNRNAIWKVINQYCSNKSDEDDIWQDTMFNAWRSFPSFRFECSFLGWITIIAKRACITHYRKLKSNLRQVFSHNIFYDIYVNNELYREYSMPSLNNLSAKERQTIDLRIAGVPYTEMSRIMNEPENRLRVRINRIIKQLSQTI